MKMNKKLAAGAMAAMMMVSSVAVAAPMTRNLQANYGVKLVVDSNAFIVTDDNMRPFITQDGRTYVSIAALNQMGIATVAFDKASKTVSIKGTGGTGVTGSVAQLQAQVAAQVAENTRLLNENNTLKAEIEKLKGTSGSGSGTSTNGTDLSKLSSSERRSLARDIEQELRYLRANTAFDRQQRLEGTVSVDSRSVSLTLYPSSPYTGSTITDWNNLVDRRNSNYIEDDYADFAGKDVKDMVKGILKGYSGYNINVTIYSDSKMGSNQKMVEADYNASRDRSSAAVYKIS